MEGSQFTFAILPQVDFNTAYWYNLVRRDLDLMQVLSITHYIDDFVIISETKDKGRADFNAMVTTNPAKAQENPKLVKFLGIT